MIAGLSKSVTLYLAPVLGLTATILSLFAFLAPAILLHDKVSLLNVVPSTALSQPGTSQSVDGPSLFMGVLGSCARTNNNSSLTCTTPSFSPVYNLDVLPTSTPRLLLSAPSSATGGFIAVALFFSIIFLFSFTLISFREKMHPKIGGIFEHPIVQRSSAWIGVFGFMTGLTAFLILRMWFGKAVQDFNNTIAAQGKDGAQVIAQTGNGFTMVWVAYAFYAVPIIISLTKLNVKMTK